MTTTTTTEAPAAVRPELTAGDVRQLVKLSAASKVKGAGEDKVAARKELDSLCHAHFTAGITLSRLAAALEVTESSIHTRIVRVRAAELAPEDSPLTLPVEEIETPKARKNRLARERRAAAREA